MKKIYLAGGCFWGVEGYFAQIDGVVSTKVGYANGQTEDTNYKILATTDHAETIEIVYDENKINLHTLLQHYFRIIDPFSVNRQGHDVGRQYRTGIYYIDEADSVVAEQMLAEIAQQSDKKVAVELESLRHFIDAEEYHQEYLKKNPNGYCHVDLNLAKVPLV